MELLHLKYFKAVAESEHMTKAANQLHIVQPSLSRTIQSLENELGVLLFDRQGKGIKLNGNGRIFLKCVDDILNNLEATHKHLLELNNKIDLEIKLLVLAGSTTVPNLIIQFRNLYQNINFSLLQSIPENVDINYFDFCISTSHESTTSENSTVILEEELFIGVPLNHRLADRHSIQLYEIADENFISFKKDKPFRKISDNFCKQAGFIPNTIFESDVPEIVRGLIKAGIGISFIPERSWSTSPSESIDKSIKLLHISDFLCKRYIIFSWNKVNHKSPHINVFKDFVLEYYKTI